MRFACNYTVFMGLRFAAGVGTSAGPSETLHKPARTLRFGVSFYPYKAEQQAKVTKDQANFQI
jgi:hypothetical protein